MKILPYILATLTQHDRQQVIAGRDFEWNSEAWVHNCFRAFELIFWRREGIKPATSMNVWEDEYGNKQQTIAFHTVESALQHAENYVRGLVPRLVPVKVWIPVFATPGMPVFASPYLFAIALDNTAAGSPAFGTGTSTTATGFTITATNSLIVAYAYDNGSGAYLVSSVTSSNGTFTAVDNQVLSGGGHAALAYYLGATTVSQTITATQTSSAYGLQVVSYTGAKQSGQPDSNNKGTTASATSSSTSTTVVAANCWLVLATVANTQAPVAGTGSTVRQRENSTNGTGLFDSNGTVSTGSQSMTVTTSANANYAKVIASFAPSTATQSSGFLAFM